ncbi:MAG: undecaprenyl-diphosphate phosphatase [Pseudomonadota bacterium]
MPLVQLIVLAIVQGITEFLPISSSAHLILAPAVAPGWEDQGPLIDVAAHVGTLAAVLLYFRSETKLLTVGAFDAARLKWTPGGKLFALLSLATVPMVLAALGLAALDLLDDLRSPRVIAWSTIIFAVFLYLADQFGRRLKSVSDVGWGTAALMGLAQATALIPGASRAGVTITAARALGFKREEAARFSMLMAIPAIMVLGAYAFLQILEEGAPGTLTDALIVAGLSCATALLVIHLFLKMAKATSFLPFVLYRFALGGALFWWLAQQA